jgi:UDP-4-amino-4,6-dideoxy-N-acetyl-beta-L-altrosamine transaminase
MDVIPYGKQDVNQRDIDAVLKVLQSDFLTQGPAVPKFEQAVANYCGANFGVAVNSATSALHLACLALQIERGDWVWTTPITFVASANCAAYCGARLDFVDIDPTTYNLSPSSLEQKLIVAQVNDCLPKAVIVVHFAGQSCDMQSIYALSQRYGFKIIEDASHAIGGKYRALPIGGCQYSDITIFSFHPVKIITTGEGGMALTNDISLAERMMLLRTHGVIKTESNLQIENDEEIWNYRQIDLGFNYRMTDIQAALGLSQMQRLDEFVEERNLIAARYDELLSCVSSVVAPAHSLDCYSSFHLYCIRCKSEGGNMTQISLYKAMHAAGIRVNLHYIPVYRQPYYTNMGFARGYCPHAEKYFKETLTLPLYVGLKEPEQDRVVAVIRKLEAQ